MKWRRNMEQAPAVEGSAGPDTGWATTSMSPGAMANWTAVVRWSAWGLLLTGPLLGGWALASTAQPAVVPTQAEAPRVQPASADAVAPAGFAELYVAAYVKAGQGDAAVQELAAFYPAARSMTWPSQGGAEHAESASAVQVRQISAGYWSVTVAARITGVSKDDAGQLHYFQVPVRSTAGTASGWVAAALPAEVAAPAGDAAKTPELSYGSGHAPLASDPAAQTVQGFLAAYLTGQGDVERYLSPGTTLHPVRPAPYTAVTLTQIADHGQGPAEGAEAQTPPDGVQRRLLVSVEGDGRNANGWPMTYAIELRARGGRWEIAALEAAPALATSGNSSPPQKGQGS
ncbi:conjugal transfer protein [Streptomyces yunnanensis]|uniref:Conjugative transposon protein TcpC n=1 Tax=Streptomyces yunnanensis TaxID=156453 RepID=A0A9X8R065_9ACTN|nr:conjugal transfer protein [Streptomyces yunnanensis]SHN31114.1 Conjugative transposon protein TcpC [Streptomyces yunnanensis]